MFKAITFFIFPKKQKEAGTKPTSEMKKQVEFYDE